MDENERFFSISSTNSVKRELVTLYISQNAGPSGNTVKAIKHRLNFLAPY
jgi:hypothetical protein